MTDRQTTHAPGCWSWGPRHYECALREIEALRADLAESDEIREKLGHLLTRTAAALKGDPPEGVWHSWHDLPERAALAIRLADDAAESVIHSEGIRSADGRINIAAEQIAADPYLDDCLAHLEWRGMATVERGSEGVTVEMSR